MRRRLHEPTSGGTPCHGARFASMAPDTYARLFGLSFHGAYAHRHATCISGIHGVVVADSEGEAGAARHDEYATPCTILWKGSLDSESPWI